MNTQPLPLLFGHFSPESFGIYLEISSAVLALFVAGYHFVRDFSKVAKAKTDPITILARAAGLAILPQSLLMMGATFDPALLCLIQGLRIFFMLSGLSLLYVCVRSVTS